VTAGDDGSAEPALATALAAYAREPSPTTEARVHAALVAARVYAPGVLRARSGATQTAAKAMALLTLRAADGSSGIAVFSDLQRLVDFRSDARPLPVRGADVLATAVAEGHASVVVDVQGPVAFVVDGEALRSLAAGYVPVVGAEDRLSAKVTEGSPELRAPDKVPSPRLVWALSGVLDEQPRRAAASVQAAYVLDSRVGDGDWERLIALVLTPDSDAAALGDLAEQLVEVLTPHLGRDGIGLMALAAGDGASAARLAAPVWQRV